MSGIDDMRISIESEDSRNFTFILGGNIWTVTMCSNITDENGVKCGGFTFSPDKAIYLMGDESAGSTLFTFFHELTHAILATVSYYYPDTNEEYICDHIGTFLPQILPQLPSWIIDECNKKHDNFIKYIHRNFPKNKKK